jgi:hypothetical protein
MGSFEGLIILVYDFGSQFGRKLKELTSMGFQLNFDWV